MLLIDRKGTLIFAYNPTSDRYIIAPYNGPTIDESNNRSAIDATWRRLTSK